MNDVADVIPGFGLTPASGCLPNPPALAPKMCGFT